LLHAVNGISFAIGRGETVGLVGESGCGKSTVVRLIARLIDASDGSIGFEGEEIGGVPARRFGRAPQRAQIQVVFQDATDSLNPRFTAFRAIADPLLRLRRLSGAALRDRVEQAWGRGCGRWQHGDHHGPCGRAGHSRRSSVRWPVWQCGWVTARRWRGVGVGVRLGSGGL
jgi:ABC-type dipeptide/oligopeptide/nickel transport system ATPase component